MRFWFGEVLMKSIAPGAVSSVRKVKEQPEEVRKEMERERMIDAIKEEAEEVRRKKRKK